MATRDPEAKMTATPATYRLTGIECDTEPSGITYWGGFQHLPLPVARAIAAGDLSGEVFRIRREGHAPEWCSLVWMGGSVLVPLEVADEIGAPR